MTHFWHGVGTWLASIWSHHPTTWQSWADYAYLATVTIAMAMIVANWKKPIPGMVSLAGISAAVNAIASATLGNSFLFWLWLVIAGILLSKPYYLWRKARRQKKAAAAKAAAKT